MNKIYHYLLLLAMLAGLTACDDDFGREYGIPDGESLLTMRLDFRDFTPALTKSRGMKGDTIKEINELWVAVYQLDGTNVLTQRIDDFTVRDVRPNTRPDTINSTETQTGHAEFKLRLYNDRYRIYAIANYDLSSLGPNPTEDEIKNVQLTWKEKTEQNDAMFGFFTTSDTENPPTTFNAPEVVVRGTGTLHAWLRRAVSKLTIVYDGSGLKEGVFVYIKSAQIKDMPYDCLLGADNDYNRIANGYKLVDGDTIKYYQGDTEPDDLYDFTADYKNRVTCGGPLVGSHADDANSLFFFENIQPKGKVGTVTDKRQDVSGENKQVSYPGGKFETSEAWKDGRPYGTYVEIKGYYMSIAEGKMSQGPITYRFMLGKNVIDDYAAERNYHYKLTMTFKGYANDVDFHIDYKVRKPSAMIPPMFISYLYNHSAYHSISISSGNKKIKKIQADIVENHWWPTGATQSPSWGEQGVYWGAGVDAKDNYQWHGFLSLRKTKEPVLTGNSAKYGPTDDNAKYYYSHLRHSREYSDMSVDPVTKDAWHSKDNRAVNPPPIELTVVPKNYKEETGDEYYVKLNDKDPDSLVYELKIPMYTRAKQMIKSSAYTGNNPYVAYQRGAMVKYQIWLEGDAESKPSIVETVPITQVRRIVNPKGIYRTENDNSDFWAELLVLPREEDTDFINLASEGRWRAEVLGDQIVTLGLSRGTGGNSMIDGKTGSDLQFNVQFTGTPGEAVIRVEYHDYTCQHLIFVRKGSGKVQLLDKGPQWYYTNLRTKDTECKLPQEEGSLFKYGNLDMPLDASTNKNDKPIWINVTFKDFQDPRDKDLNIATSDYSTTMKTTKWKGVWAKSSRTQNFDNTNAGKPGVSGRIATLTDYNDMRKSADIGYGYGVLYGDGATECAKTIQDAYGYIWNNTEKAKQGMRGVFIYNQNANSAYFANNIFLPIGNSGYGHRRTENRSQGGDPDQPRNDPNSSSKFLDYAGLLKYAARNDYYKNNVDCRPLFYDLWRRPGAIYWLASPHTINLGAGDGTQTYLGWDINYFTFDYFGFMAADLFLDSGASGTGNYNTSACFVRMVN